MSWQAVRIIRIYRESESANGYEYNLTPRCGIVGRAFLVSWGLFGLTKASESVSRIVFVHIVLP